MAKISLLILAIAMAITIGFLFQLANPSNPILFAFTIGFAVWNLMPYIALGLMTWNLQYYPKPALVLLLGSILMSGLSVLALVYTLIVEADAQSPIIFFVLPLGQWLFVTLIGIISNCVHFATRDVKSNGGSKRICETNETNGDVE
jgi:hypothetical protein